MTFNPRALDKLLSALDPRFDVPETDLQTLIYNTREKLAKEIEFLNATRHPSQELNTELYLYVFDGLCGGYNYEKIGKKFGVSCVRVYQALERLRKFDALIEFYAELKEMMRTG